MHCCFFHGVDFPYELLWAAHSAYSHYWPLVWMRVTPPPPENKHKAPNLLGKHGKKPTYSDLFKKKKKETQVIDNFNQKLKDIMPLGCDESMTKGRMLDYWLAETTGIELRKIVQNVSRIHVNNLEPIWEE